MVAEPVQEGVDHVLGFQQDNPSNALPIMKLLEKAGHTVTLAENGQQALDKLAAQDFDVILMDVQMPVLNGVEATKTIRQSASLGEKKNIPIVALTAYAMTGDREKFLEADMNDYLSKPVKMEDLAKVLERFAVNANKLLTKKKVGNSPHPASNADSAHRHRQLPWQLIPGAPVQRTPRGLFVPAAPLLEEKGNPLLRRSLANIPDPGRIHRPRSKARFAPYDDPIQSRDVQ